MGLLPHNLVFASAAIVALFLTPGSTLAAAADKPNVLFIAIDDQNDWIGCLGGHPLVKTPHIDRLAGRGTLFLNAHVQSPLCNPCRTSLLLGLRSTTTGIYGLAPWFRTVDAWKDRTTLPQYFKENGYRTLTTGKIYHGVPPRDRPREFDVWGPPGGVGVRPPEKLIPPTPMGNHPLMDWGVFPHKDEDKGDWQVASWGVEQIKNPPKDQPFFLAVGFFLPHVPCYATQKWFDLYPDDDSVLPPVKEDDRDDTPRFSWYMHWNLPEPRLKWLRENNQWRNLVRSYLACTSFVDSQVGRLIDALETTGLADNTVVVLWGDHGWHLGDQSLWCKHTNFEVADRAPLIISAPGQRNAGACTDALSEFVDIYPTLCDLAGLPVPDGLEGTSLKPVMDAPERAWKAAAFSQYPRGEAMGYSMTTPRYRYTEWLEPGKEPLGVELYDHVVDPGETANLAAHPEKRVLAAGLSKRLKAGWRAALPRGVRAV